LRAISAINAISAISRAIGSTAGPRPFLPHPPLTPLGLSEPVDEVDMRTLHRPAPRPMLGAHRGKAC
jgi:hypothetical protein